MRIVKFTFVLVVTASSASAASIPTTLHGIYANNFERCRAYEQKGRSILRQKDHLYRVVHQYGFSTYWETIPVVRSRGPNNFEAMSGDTPATITKYLMSFIKHNRLSIEMVGADGPEVLIRCRDPVRSSFN